MLYGCMLKCTGDPSQMLCFTCCSRKVSTRLDSQYLAFRTCISLFQDVSIGGCTPWYTRPNCIKFIYWCSRGYNDTIMISGVSSGGVAAVQQAIAHSSIFKGCWIPSDRSTRLPLNNNRTTSSCPLFDAPVIASL
jgi:hypothetical protein